MAIVLSEADVRELVPIPDLIYVMERALAAFSSGQVNQPLRTCVEVGANRREPRLPHHSIPCSAIPVLLAQSHRPSSKGRLLRELGL